MKALTVRQPWAEAISRGVKDIENRTWRTAYRGPLVIQSSAKPEHEAFEIIMRRHGIDLRRSSLATGCAICVVDLVDIVEHHPSRWFNGPLGWVLRNARPFPPIPMKGQLSIFNPPPRVIEHVRRHVKGI